MLGRWRVEIISAATWLVIGSALTALFIDHHLDRSFITYRYARHLANGQGLVYNPGQPYLSDAVAPLYAVVLGLGTVATADIPLLSNLIGSLSIMAGAAALYALAYPTDRLLALLSAGIYLIFPVLWGALGLETGLWMALGLVAIWMHWRGWGAGTALLLGLATLMRPEIGVLAVVLALDSMIRGRPLRLLPTGVYAGVVVAGLLWLMGTFEQSGPLPGLPSAQLGRELPDVVGTNVFVGLVGLAQALVALSWLWLTVLPLILLGALNLRGQGWAWLPIGWAALHLVTLAVLDVAVYAWSLAPVIPALTTLIGLGVRWLAGRIPAGAPRWVGAAALIGLIGGAASQSALVLGGVLPAGSSDWRALAPNPVDPAYRRVGEWLHDNTPADAWVGATQGGALGYVSGRPLIDYRGTFQADVAEALMRGDDRWWVAAYTPDYVVLSADEYANLGFDSDAWFGQAYAEVARLEADTVGGDAVLIFQRMVEAPSMSETPTGVSLPGGVSVNRIATDFPLNPLGTGRMGRVRIEWFLESVVEQPQYVSIRIRGRDGTVAAMGGQPVDFSNWPLRHLITTYHTLELAPALPPGAYDVDIGIGPDPFNLHWQTVTRAKVPFQGETFLGGISGVRADFGDISLLGYRIGQTEEGLEVLLLWQANRPPQADYRILIQVRAGDGNIIAQVEVEPYEGIYPTSFWSSGEQVPDTHVLSLESIPAGAYDVYVGLIGPDGNRLLTVTGQIAIFVGHVSIGEP